VIKILVVEDDQQIAASLEIRFKANGYITFAANDAVQAARLAVQNKPDLIILDISIPGGSGLTLAEKFHELPETQGVPIIFLTASKDPQLREKATNLNVAGLFEKPYDIEELLATVKYLLKESTRPLLDSSSIQKRQTSGPKKVLIIEDDSNIAMALALRLQAAGYDTTLAFDAVLGLSAAIRTVPDVVLLDISMPAGNGLTLAEKIQKLIPQPPPIIFLTASKQPGLRLKAEQLGAAAFFEKPYEAEELVAAVHQVVRKERKEEGTTLCTA